MTQSPIYLPLSPMDQVTDCVGDSSAQLVARRVSIGTRQSQQILRLMGMPLTDNPERPMTQFLRK